MSKSKNNCIGITLGDPSGIGPEITAKALSSFKNNNTQFKIIGDNWVYEKYAKRLPKNCHFIDLKQLSPKNWQNGTVNKKSGIASIKYLEHAVQLLKKKEISALVTAPVCKEAICLTDPTFHGHTEFLAQCFNQKHVDMMFVASKLKTVIVTRHLPIKNLSNAIKLENVYQTIQLTNRALKKYFKIKNPLIAVCGLNPHAGEAGTIGKEEIQSIIPAIKKARKSKMRVEGPLSADTLFSPHLNHPFDAIVAMYHDQGLIPIKTLYFPKLVNLTIGLPFVRTSPAHGTAFDIAGQNKADPTSMIETIKLAAQLL